MRFLSVLEQYSVFYHKLNKIMSQAHHNVSAKKDVGKNILKRPLSSSGFSLENRNRIKNVLRNQKSRGKCCGR